MLSRNNPKTFYKKFSKLKKGPKCDLTIEDFINHFKDLAGSTRDNTQETDDSTNQDNQVLYEELDSPITVHEILYVLSKAKRNKSPGIDGLLYEFFVECKYIMIPILCNLFNVILDSGIIPENWCNGTIIPVFKKGDTFIHMQFCKRILGVKRNTTNMLVYSELGRLPLYISMNIRIVKYWIKLLNTDNCILKECYATLYDECLKNTCY